MKATDLLREESESQPYMAPVETGGGTNGRRTFLPIATWASWSIAAIGIALRLRQFAFAPVAVERRGGSRPQHHHPGVRRTDAAARTRPGCTDRVPLVGEDGDGDLRTE